MTATLSSTTGAEDDIQRRLMQQQAVSELGLAALRTDDGIALMQQAVEYLGQVLEADFCNILEFVPEMNSLVLRAGVGFHEEMVGNATEAAHRNSQAGYTLRRSESVIVDDLRTETRFEAMPFLRQQGVVSGMTAIIHGREHPFGVMGVHSRQRRMFSPDDVNFLQSVANIVAAFMQRRQVEETLRLREAEYRQAMESHLTEARKAEEATYKLKALVEGTDDAIYLNSLDGIIMGWNPGAERLYGYKAEEVIRQPASIIIPPDRLQEDEDISERVRRGEHVPAFDTVRQRRDGQLIHVSLTVSPVRDRTNRIVAISRIASDISEKKDLEERFRQAQKMEAIGQLAGGVAHDFNNLLTIVNGYSELLLRRLDRGDPMRELLSEIRKAGERGGTLTRQLLAFSRQQVMEPKVLDLNAEVSDTEKMLRRLIGEDVLLSNVLDPWIGRVKMDPGQLQQVLMNLAVNARDAMPQGGKLTIETRRVTLDADWVKTMPDAVPGDYVMLAVTDTGTGMDEKTKARIFEPFFTTKGVGKGTGLGLAVVHGIVKQSGGQILVYSEVGHGTVFKIYLPELKEATATGKSTAGFRSMPPGSETVLLVEDDDAVRALVRHVLRTCGYTMLEAGNGAEALRVAESFPGSIELLVSDVVMPHLGGRQLVESLASVKPGIKTLFLSGYTDDAVVRHGVLQAEYAFLQKPFTTAALAQKVREVLDQERVLA